MLSVCCCKNTVLEPHFHSKVAASPDSIHESYSGDSGVNAENEEIITEQPKSRAASAWTLPESHFPENYQNSNVNNSSNVTSNDSSRVASAAGASFVELQKYVNQVSTKHVTCASRYGTGHRGNIFCVHVVISL